MKPHLIWILVSLDLTAAAELSAAFGCEGEAASDRALWVDVRLLGMGTRVGRNVLVSLLHHLLQILH